LLALQLAIGIAFPDAAILCHPFEGVFFGEIFSLHQSGHFGGDGPMRCGGFFCRLRREQQNHLAANDCACGELGAKFADGTAQELFVQLGQFAGDDGVLRCSEDCLDIGESVHDTMRGFIEDVSSVVAGKLFESSLALARLGGKKAVEGEVVGGEAAGDQGADSSVRTGDGKDGDACGDGGCGDLAAGIGDAGGSGIADDGDACALL